MRRISYLLILLLGVSAVGCTMIEPTTAKNGDVELSVEQSRSVQISNVIVTKEGGKILVRGTARYPIWVAFGVFRGHVDVHVKISEEKEFTLHNVKLHRRRIPRKYGRTAFFSAEIPVQSQPGLSILPQADMSIRVDYTESPHTGGNKI